MIITRLLLIMSLAIIFAGTVRARNNALPPELAQVLHNAQHAMLYSLEPWADPEGDVPRLQRYQILGRTELDATQTSVAAKEFEGSVGQWNGMVAMCFDPRHALRIVAEGHTYDFLLCYRCQELYVYRDESKNAIAMLGASGSPQILNDLLVSANVPLSTSDSDEERAEAAKRGRQALERWFAAMPKSLLPFREAMLELGQGNFRREPDAAQMSSALREEIAGTSARIRSLLGWYGSGAGPWSGYPAYEMAAEKMLLEYPTGEIVAAIGDSSADDTDIEGAARFLASWELRQKRPHALAEVPSALKQTLLRHVLTTPLVPRDELADQDRHERAIKAFSD